MQPGGTLAGTFGWLVGAGPGAGFGLLIFLCGIGGILVGLSGYLVKEIRSLDMQIPDYKLPEPDTFLEQSQPVSNPTETVLESASSGPDTETISGSGESQTPGPES